MCRSSSYGIDSGRDLERPLTTVQGSLCQCSLDQNRTIAAQTQSFALSCACSNEALLVGFADISFESRSLSSITVSIDSLQAPGQGFRPAESIRARRLLSHLRLDFISTPMSVATWSLAVPDKDRLIQAAFEGAHQMNCMDTSKGIRILQIF